MSAESEVYYQFVEELRAKDKWQLEWIINAALERARVETLPDSTWFQAHTATHLLMERATMNAVEEP